MNRTVKKLAIVLLVLTPIMVVIAFAQQKDEKRPKRFHRSEMTMGILDLSEEQRSKIGELRLDLMKESLPLRNKLNENRARFKSLSTAENVDMNAINELIDENVKLQADLQKKAALNHQNIRELLTEDQRVVFDSGSRRRMAMMGRMHNFRETGVYPGRERQFRERRHFRENEE